MIRRFRRLRRGPAVRRMLCETTLRAEHLIAPVFIKPSGPPEPVGSMPGIFRFNAEDAVRECRELEELGIRAVALFPCVPGEMKSVDAAAALDAESFIHRAMRELRRALPGMVLIGDVALDPYTPHGHDGILGADGDVDNDRTVEVLARMAVVQADQGVDWVAPSDMMDGRVAAIRSALDAAGHIQTAILSYAAKFASAFYGPFRDAVGSKQKGDSIDKRTYQADPANARQAVADALQDEVEGADLLMVKPAGLYLDVLHELRQRTMLPLVAYQVSGEYAMLHAAAAQGWLDLARVREESLLAIRRAGADLIVSYFARAMAEQMRARG